MGLLDLPREAVESLAITGGNLLAWIAHTEQIWFPTAGAYVRFVAPEYGFPDLRGPFLFLTLLYIGLRIGDLLDKQDGELIE